MDMQNVAKLNIPEGDVRTIHDKDGNLIWGKVSYGVKYKGDTAQNGTPTPGIPVPVQTVTGEQTISINGAAHTVNLGSIELCKIGDYQDYIYKSGGKWYVHKAVDKIVLDGTESNYTTRTNTSTTHSKFRIASSVLSGSIAGTSTIVCDHFIANSGANTKDYSQNAICGSTAAGYQTQLWFSIANTIANTVDSFKAWVASNTPLVYYALATPTDIEITNEALVGQLNIVEQLLTRYGYNATVSGNLPIIIDRTAL